MAAEDRTVGAALEPPLAALDAPLEFLRAAHALVRERCAQLETLAADPAASEPATARGLAGFFSTLIKLHLADEEEEIFKPLLRVSLKMADAITALRGDHEALRERWAALEPLMARPGAADPAALAEQASAFVALKRDHMAREEQLFNQAQHLLSSTQLRAIRSSMRARRGHRG